jgi:hypothetical protein
MQVRRIYTENPYQSKRCFSRISGNFAKSFGVNLIYGIRFSKIMGSERGFGDGFSEKENFGLEAVGVECLHRLSFGRADGVGFAGQSVSESHRAPLREVCGLYRALAHLGDVRAGTVECSL